MVRARFYLGGAPNGYGHVACRFRGGVSKIQKGGA